MRLAITALLLLSASVTHATGSRSSPLQRSAALRGVREQIKDIVGDRAKGRALRSVLKQLDRMQVTAKNEDRFGVTVRKSGSTVIKTEGLGGRTTIEFSAPGDNAGQPDGVATLRVMHERKLGISDVVTVRKAKFDVHPNGLIVSEDRLRVTDAKVKGNTIRPGKDLANPRFQIRYDQPKSLQ